MLTEYCSLAYRGTLDLGKGYDLVELAVDLTSMHAKNGAIEVDVLSSGQLPSGWKPVPTSSRLLTLPKISARPPVCPVIRERILSSVLFPRAVATNDTHHLTALYLDRDIVECPERVIGAGWHPDAVTLQHRGDRVT